jgi:hypothetical protein
MIGLTSGTFVGGVTHSSGYIASNGTTGYFDMGSSPSTMGLTPSSVWQGRLYKTAHSVNYQEGVYEDIAIVSTIASFASNNMQADTFGVFTGRDAFTVTNASSSNGIASFNRSSGDSRFRVRKTSGRVTYTDSTRADDGGTPTDNLYALGLNFGGSGSQMHDRQVGIIWTGLGVTDAQDSLATLAMKNLWETATSLTLP